MRIVHVEERSPAERADWRPEPSWSRWLASWRSTRRPCAPTA